MLKDNLTIARQAAHVPADWILRQVEHSQIAEASQVFELLCIRRDHISSQVKLF